MFDTYIVLLNIFKTLVAMQCRLSPSESELYSNLFSKIGELNLQKRICEKLYTELKRDDIANRINELEVEIDQIQTKLDDLHTEKVKKFYIGNNTFDIPYMKDLERFFIDNRASILG